MEVILCDLGLGNDFLHTTLVAQSIKEKFDKLDFIKIKNSYNLKDAMKRIKRLTIY